MRRVCLATTMLFLLAVLAKPSYAEEERALRDLSRFVTLTPVVRASFTQTRKIEVLSRPLHSRGHFLFSKDRGLAWLLEEPFKTNLVLTHDTVIEWEDEKPRARHALASRPSLASLKAILFPLLSGDFAELENSFASVVKTDQANWILTLTPRNDEVRKTVSSIEIKGGEAVETINVHEIGGDVTQLEFTNYQTSLADLTAEELLYFDD